MDALSAANAELSAELAKLTTGDTPLQSAQAHNRDLKSDITKFTEHITALKEHRSKMADKLEAAHMESARKQEELSQVTAEVAAHKETIAAQEVTPADVRRMHSERDQLTDALTTLKGQKGAPPRAPYPATPRPATPARCAASGNR